MQASPSEIDDQSAEITGEYPNTYVVTKSVVEHLMARNHGGIPLVIYRPATISASLIEPMPGWIDQVTGFGAAYSRFFLVPARTFSTSCRWIWPRTTCCSRSAPSSQIQTRRNHSLSTAVRRIRTRTAFRERGMSKDLEPNYFAANPLKTAVPPPRLRFCSSHLEFETRQMLRYALPTTAYSALAKVTGSESHAKTALQLGKQAERAGKFMDLFAPFSMKQRRFRADNSKLLLLYTTSKDWWIDTHQIDWDQYLVSFCGGIRKHVTQQDKPAVRNASTVSPAATSTAPAPSRAPLLFRTLRKTFALKTIASLSLHGLPLPGCVAVNAARTCGLRVSLALAVLCACRSEL